MKWNHILRWSCILFGIVGCWGCSANKAITYKVQKTVGTHSVTVISESVTPPDSSLMRKDGNYFNYNDSSIILSVADDFCVFGKISDLQNAETSVDAQMVGKNLTDKLKAIPLQPNDTIVVKDNQLWINDQLYKL